jgi:hypothetical protein
MQASGDTPMWRLGITQVSYTPNSPQTGSNNDEGRRLVIFSIPLGRLWGSWYILVCPKCYFYIFFISPILLSV